MPEIKLGKKTAYTTLITPKGELTGFNAIFEPSVKFNKEGAYNANIVLSKEDGEAILNLVKAVQKEQFKNFKNKNDKLAEIQSIVPISETTDDGEIIYDPEGKYVLKTKNTANIKDGVIGKRIAVFDSNLKPVKKLNLGAGSIVKLKVSISGYSVAGKVGVSIRLEAVQVIKYVPYESVSGTADGFEVEADGFDAETEAIEEEKAEATTAETNDEEEAF